MVLPMDGTTAIEPLIRAEGAGIGVAAHNLGTIFAADTPGVAADRDRSHVYYKEAKALGCQTAPDAFYE